MFSAYGCSFFMFFVQILQSLQEKSKIMCTCPISENVRQLKQPSPWMVAFCPTCNRRLIPTSIRGRQQRDVHVHQGDVGHPRHHLNVPRLADSGGNMHPHLLLGKVLEGMMIIEPRKKPSYFPLY